MSEPDDSLRVSDAERDATMQALGDHAAVGRLTLDELEERSGQALAAKTRGELATLTSDLPAGGEPGEQASAAPVRTRKPVRWMVAIMSGSHRRGRFRAVGSINAVAIMGGDEIDLREAEIEGGELTLNVFALMGGANIYIPDSIELEVGGFSLMGGNTEVGSSAPRPGAPRDQDPQLQPDGRRDHLPGPAAGPGPGPEGSPPPGQGRRARRAARPRSRGLTGQDAPHVGLLGLVDVRRLDDHQQPPGRNPELAGHVAAASEASSTRLPYPLAPKSMLCA